MLRSRTHGSVQIGSSCVAPHASEISRPACDNAAIRGGLLDLIEVGLLAVGGGPTLDFEDAAAFLAGLRP